MRGPTPQIFFIKYGKLNKIPIDIDTQKILYVLLNYTENIFSTLLKEHIIFYNLLILNISINSWRTALGDFPFSLIKSH